MKRLYALWRYSGHLWYVGCTGDIHRRLGEHRSKKYWWPTITHISIDMDEYPPTMAHALEAWTIREARPWHNVQHADRALSIFLGRRSGRHDVDDLSAYLADGPLRVGGFLSCKQPIDSWVIPDLAAAELFYGPRELTRSAAA